MGIVDGFWDIGNSCERTGASGCSVVNMGIAKQAAGRLSPAGRR
jgi:hypothetical protein